MCKQAIYLKGPDSLLEIDAYYLQSICYYRLNKPLESVECRKTAQRREKQINMEGKRFQGHAQQPVQEYAELFLSELDINLS